MVDDPIKRSEKTYSVNAKYCPMILPQFESEYVFDLNLATEIVISTIGADNGSCGFTCALSQLPGEPFSLHDESDEGLSGRRLPKRGDDPDDGSSSSTSTSCPGLLISPSTDLSLIGTEYTFTFTMISDNEGQDPKSE